jgi:hypothetical protein
LRDGKGLCGVVCGKMDGTARAVLFAKKVVDIKLGVLQRLSTISTFSIL